MKNYFGKDKFASSPDISDASAIFIEQLDKETENAPESSSDEMKELVQEVGSRIKIKTNNIPTELMTGFDGIDSNFSILSPGLTVIDGKTKIGKTAFAIQLALQVSEENNKEYENRENGNSKAPTRYPCPIIFFTWDSRKDIKKRMLLSLSGISNKDFRGGNFTIEEITPWLKMYRFLGQHIYIVQGDKNMYPSKMYELVQHILVAHHGGDPATVPVENAGLVIIDNIESVPFASRTNAVTKEYTTELATAEIRDMVRKFRIPVLLLSNQFAPDTTVSEAKDFLVTIESKMSAIKANLTGVADVYASLVEITKDETTKEAVTKNDVVDLQFVISKNRHASEGMILLKYNKAASKFVESDNIKTIG